MIAPALLFQEEQESTPPAHPASGETDSLAFVDAIGLWVSGHS